MSRYTLTQALRIEEALDESFRHWWPIVGDGPIENADRRRRIEMVRVMCKEAPDAGNSMIARLLDMSPSGIHRMKKRIAALERSSYEWRITPRGPQYQTTGRG